MLTHGRFDMTTLYVVATPIGNLEDITLRALRILSEVSIIAAEDTRTTRKLLSHYEIHTPLTSYHDHNRNYKIPIIIKALAKADVALVSEAGTPGVSDPGLELVRAAIAEGISVISIPGPSAVITALAASGISAKHFLFLGFIPRKKSERKTLLLSLSDITHTIVLFESPHRLKQTLADMHDILGDRPLAVVREATKLYEEIFRGTAYQCQEYFRQPRGEFTLIIEAKTSLFLPSYTEATKRLRELLLQGFSGREARRETSIETGLRRKDIYQMWLSLSNDMDD